MCRMASEMNLLLLLQKFGLEGEVQFLVKWCGWPESANTWEPYENVKICSDILEEFEKRPSRRPGRGSKRKLRNQHKKDKTTRDAETNNSVSTEKSVVLAEEPTAKESQLGLIVSENPNSSPPTGTIVEAQPLKISSANEQPAKTTCTTSSTGDEVVLLETENFCNSQNNHLGNTVTEVDSRIKQKDELTWSGSITQTECRDTPEVTGITVGIVAEQKPPLDKDLLLHTDKFTGAKKRKSGCVRRLNQNETGQLHEVKPPCSEQAVKENGMIVSMGALQIELTKIFMS
ncbi:hypothetical protein O6H91_02G043600 [Diphasiastrum complanatum]|uniref:Uncharacterized protein n=1 Tax=Diphasiastrum complanatum TaxID=34168 RepID=A0ACC2EEQ2_DIPCM|nr:hypothetical protein O6H91_02G043600 [Diphasiastrum complanatum]